MNYIASGWSIVLFICIVILVLLISYHFGRKTKTSNSYYAAGGNIHWSVNGIAFAGDYLSAASFLGICGMIATSGYDGFLYSIGYLAGWIVALFLVAEPMKKLGKYTFTDALDAKFNSKGIKLASAISTLLVSMFYLIPQMVGAGSLITPLLGLPHWAGVVMVGTIVTVIVATAGMASTTYVQFFKGAMLLIFSIALVFLIFSRGINTAPDQGGDVPYHQFKTIKLTAITPESVTLADSSYKIVKEYKGTGKGNLRFVKLEKGGDQTLWRIKEKDSIIDEALYVVNKKDGSVLYNGAPKTDNKFFQVGSMSKIDGKTDTKTGTLDVFSFIEKIKDGTVVRWSKNVLKDGDDKMSVYYQNPTPGKEVLRPGQKFKVDAEKGATTTDQIDFISLMIALFLGTAALPHILIRYYTVKSPSAARKSTIVAIGAIGLFYILTLYMGLGAMVNGVIDLTNDNMSAPLLAKSFGTLIFSIISALAFATILGTVSGLTVAAAGAVAHDLMDKYFDMKLSDSKKVFYGKIASVGVGAGAIMFGILFKDMNVSYLVGWAFAIAASANLPAILMILFWKKTTAAGVMASIIVGLFSALGLILLSQETYNNVYGLVGVVAPVQINNPAIFSVPLSFLTLYIVSLLTQKSANQVQVRKNQAGTAANME
jgi:cation/acetate symporter